VGEYARGAAEGYAGQSATGRGDDDRVSFDSSGLIAEAAFDSDRAILLCIDVMQARLSSHQQSNSDQGIRTADALRRGGASSIS
jgi:hypothetical protein